MRKLCVDILERMARYLHGHAPSVLASHTVRTAENSCGYLLPYLREGMRVLDVGCGPATITLDLAALVGPSGQVTGLELFEETLELGRTEAAKRGDDRTRFEAADVMALPYDDGSFDVVHAHQVLQHLTDPVAALREMWRVLAPGCVLAARDADYAEMSWYPQPRELDRWRELYLAVARANEATPDAARHLRAWARAAALENIKLGASTWTYADEETCAWWGKLWQKRALTSRFTEEVLERELASQDELEAISRAWQAWGSDPGAMFIMTHGELLAFRQAN